LQATFSGFAFGGAFEKHPARKCCWCKIQKLKNMFYCSLVLGQPDM